MKKFGILRQYQWKILLLRIVVNAIALSLTVLLVPDIYFVDFSVGSLLIVTLVLSLLNALVRPVLQFLTFRMLFGSFGLIIVVINAFILYLLARFVPTQFVVSSLFWAFVGGLLIGIFSNFLENLFGITMPILPDEEKELRRRVAEQDVSMIEAWIKERKAARAAMQLEAPAGGTEPVGGGELTGVDEHAATTPPGENDDSTPEEVKSEDIPPGNSASGGEA